MAITLQTGIREFTGNLSEYSGMRGGLVPDMHTLKSLNPLTTNRVLCVMFRGPFFMMHYFKTGKATDNNAYDPKNEFGQYKKIIEYYNTGITPGIGDGSLASSPLQGGFAGRSLNFPTVQNANNNQTLMIQVPEMDGRPVANFHNMWIDGIADPVTGLTTYHGLVGTTIKNSAGSWTTQRIFSPVTTGGTPVAGEFALEPSPAWEIAEFMLILLDRSGAKVEAATMALGCVPSAKVGLNEAFTHNATGQSQIQQLNLNFSCQYIQSAYVNDLASRYLAQFATFGNSLNLNPGAGDAFFNTDAQGKVSDRIDTALFNHGNRPTLDSVQSGLGTAPVMQANPTQAVRVRPNDHAINPVDHFNLYQGLTIAGKDNVINEGLGYAVPIENTSNTALADSSNYSRRTGGNNG